MRALVIDDSRAVRVIIGKILREIGMEVLAIQRGGRWIYRPRASQSFAAGDKVIAVGPEDGAHDLALLFGNEPPEEE